MLKRFLKRQTESFGAQFNYDVTYMTEVLDHDAGAYLKLGLMQPMTQHQKGIPDAPYYAAKLLAAMGEDCGPCTQLCVNMAELAGVDSVLLKAVIEADTAAMTEEVLLAYRFTRACLSHSAEADELREIVLERWGMDGLVSLSYVIATSRVYPTMKYVLGHGKTCQRLVVEGETISLATHDGGVAAYG